MRTVGWPRLSRILYPYCFFLVDTLEYLRRGGRIGRAGELLGSLLQLKPLLSLRNGEIEPIGQLLGFLVTGLDRGQRAESGGDGRSGLLRSQEVAPVK